MAKLKALSLGALVVAAVVAGAFAGRAQILPVLVSLLPASSGSHSADLHEEEHHAPDSRKEPEPEKPSLVKHAAVMQQPDPQIDPQKILEYADHLLLSGRESQAQPLYDQLLAEHPTLGREVLIFRQAIAAEVLGANGLAIDRYRELASSDPSRRDFVRAGRLGQARLWMQMNRPELAVALLCDLWSNSTGGLLDAAIHAEAAHLLSQAFAIQTEPAADMSDSHDRSIARPPLHFTAVQLLDTAKTEGSVSDRSVAPSQTVVVEFQTEPHPANTQVNVAIPPMPIEEFVTLLAAQAKFRVEWTSQAATAVLGSKAAMTLEHMNLAILLDLILAPRGLVWEEAGGVIRILAEEECQADVLHELKVQTARRALRRALSDFADHHLVPAAYVSLANLEFRVAHYAEAATLYQQLLREHSQSEILCEAYFNLAKTEMLLGRTAKSREAFFAVVDRSPGHRLEAVSYLYLSRLFLNEMDSRQAARVAGRAVALARSAEIRGLAACNLAAAQCMEGNPRIASSMLMEHRELLQHSSSRDVSAFLSALAGYRSRGAGSSPSLEGRELIVAMSRVAPDMFFGEYGYLMMGQALTDLSMLDAAKETYRKGLEQGLTDELSHAVSYAMADVCCTEGDTETAGRILTDLAGNAKGKWAPKASLRLAQLTYDLNQDELCKSACLTVLQGQSQDEAKRAAIQLLGKLYERRGEYQNAASCFAGTIPGELITTADAGADSK